jgi:hypothetical protein
MIKAAITIAVVGIEIMDMIRKTAGPAVERQLGANVYDCVVIGAGIRVPLASPR